MYQFYYADQAKKAPVPEFRLNLQDVFSVEAVRAAMWEEHCLECAAPLCFEKCAHYARRSDGRCKRFENGMDVYDHALGCCGQGMHIRFRKWANMMTIVFPAMLGEKDYARMNARNALLGKGLGLLADCGLPVSMRWMGIRTIEFIRRKMLRRQSGMTGTPNAFVFHGYSHQKEDFRLIIEIYDDHTPVFKTAMTIKPGENLVILDEALLSDACWTAGHLVKIYPENDLEAELDILWCDFVLGKAIVQGVPAPQVKCVVWDLDGTLWDGILIETENADELSMRPQVLDVIKALDERGIVQSVASKNDHQAAWAVLEKLGVTEYFLYPQIHWNAKSDSLSEIAAQLNIGVDAFALIDDSVFEREQVRAALPQVRVYDVCEIGTLLQCAEFDVPVTQESKARRAMYRAEEKRNTLRSERKTDIAEFVRSCHLRMEVFEPTTQEELLRCYELIVRTNQLNMSGRKYTRDEFDRVMEKKERISFAMRCEDDFGSYGIVGFGQYHLEENVLIFDEFAMSCRVAGKYVESALFAQLLEKEQCSVGRFAVVKTKKNALLRNTLNQIGFCSIEENEDCVDYRFDMDLVGRDIVEVQ